MNEENEILNENVVENTIAGTETVDNTLIENIQVIHDDLGLICSFLIFFTLVILLKYVYKFFNMFFVI